MVVLICPNRDARLPDQTDSFRHNYNSKPIKFNKNQPNSIWPRPLPSKGAPTQPGNTAQKLTAKVSALSFYMDIGVIFLHLHSERDKEKESAAEYFTFMSVPHSAETDTDAVMWIWLSTDHLMKLMWNLQLQLQTPVLSVHLVSDDDDTISETYFLYNTATKSNIYHLPHVNTLTR